MSQVFTSSTIPLSFGAQHEPGPWIHGAGKGATPEVPSDNTKEDAMSPIFNCMIAGGLGGMVGDTLMHSLDTVKTRQQGFPNKVQYKRMIPAYLTIFKQEGFFRGLYSGYTPAILGSFPSTAAFFATYEWTKRRMINDYGINETLSYFVAGVLGDLASSVFYVPSEVLKTRLQLQGRHNNPHTKGSGYNYKGLTDAVIRIGKQEGPKTFVFGYKETLFRDLPFSALQFAFYEKFRQLAIYSHGSSDLPVSWELLTGAAAGGLAGTLTTPLDVIKTRIQTATTINSVVQTPSTNPLARILSNSSTYTALASIYKSEGILGAFSGVGPRFIWTGIQSSIMLLLYQVALKRLDQYTSPGEERAL
ncbi:putative mitochondrial carrier [Suhomyces tanzawaensis NRRL Y-17324]|uniref:Mitochondrial thiamine pyrophosphate carrier 1 n=1 Tax=Suhomyces tanzawaensis NRRL Y-17324 TaxID=984487 RepID=A0A1E4SDZ7_9ASCO|nr:putative mitochondrial carrier [Suhomyces tanzawaensis NRRL Y-17324]ODV77744.1 putative mitochondrial carrier [Suhomyces tanzawaensis NRRL Y-17324]